jgi:hypothetical protein
MMNAIRYQFALNSENSEVVKQGLQELYEIVVKENDVPSQLLLHHSKDISQFQSVSPKHIVHWLNLLTEDYPVGLLDEYLQGSPQLEEFFTLWNLPARSSDKALCDLHMRCVAAIIISNSNDKEFVRFMGQRVMKEFGQSIIEQLTNGTIPLKCSTLRLIIIFLKYQQPLPEDLFTFFISNHFNLGNLKGKDIKLKLNSDNTELENNHLDLQAHTSLLICLILSSNDPSQTSQLLNSPSVFSSLLQRLSGVDLESLSFSLSGFLYLFQEHYHLKLNIHKIFSENTLKKILKSSKSTHMERFDLIDSFLTQIFNELSSDVNIFHENSNVSKNIREFFSTLNQALDPINYSNHRAVSFLYS